MWRLSLDLDYYGCLHCKDVWRHPKRGIYVTRGRLLEHAAALVVALEEFSDLPIVLSTSWVRMLGFRGTVKRLPSGLQARVLGATHIRRCTTQCEQLIRYQQILPDAHRRRLGDWLANDDDTKGASADQRHRLVSPRGTVGPQSCDLALLVRRLLEQH